MEFVHEVTCFESHFEHGGTREDSLKTRNILKEFFCLCRPVYRDVHLFGCLVTHKGFIF
jgi:hypothetical protein